VTEQLFEVAKNGDAIGPDHRCPDSTQEGVAIRLIGKGAGLITGCDIGDLDPDGAIGEFADVRKTGLGREYTPGKAAGVGTADAELEFYGILLSRNRRVPQSRRRMYLGFFTVELQINVENSTPECGLLSGGSTQEAECGLGCGDVAFVGFVPRIEVK